MANLPFIAFYPSKWLGRTAQLSAVERGVFITLICEMYERQEPLVNDDKRLARLCGCTPATFRKVVLILLDDCQKMIEKNGRLWNNKVEEEIKTAKKKSEKMRKNSSVRWEKHNKNNEDAMQLQCYQDKDLDKDNNKPISRVKSNDSSKDIQSSKNLNSGNVLFDPKRWFTENEIEFLTVQHPKINVVGKISDKTFRDWAFKADSQNPLLPARNWFKGQKTKTDAENNLISDFSNTRKMPKGDHSHLIKKLRKS